MEHMYLNLNEYEETDAHWVACCFKNDDSTYFDRFGVF